MPGSSAPVSPVLALIGFVGLCLLVGAAGGTITSRAMHGWYGALHRPPGTPPNWTFGLVWTVLYVLIGVAAWLIWRRQGASRPLRLWGWQLAANALWVPAFFGLHSPGLAMGVIVVLLALLGVTIRSFLAVRRLAALLLAPYLLWSLYAAYLNAGFWVLNRV